MGSPGAYTLTWPQSTAEAANPSEGRDLFERSLETMRLRYDFVIAGYVVMPEHVHLLVSEPKRVLLGKAIQALKLSVSVQSRHRPFWQPRYYDFNVYTPHKRSEKVEYMHKNPVKRGLVSDSSDWPWSSYRRYASGHRGTVEIESIWTATARKRAAAESHVSEARHGAPDVGEG